MQKQIGEAVELFEEVMIYGQGKVLKSINTELWKKFSPEQIQMLKLIKKEEKLTSNQLAELQGVHKSAISNRLKKLVEKNVVTMLDSEEDQRTKYIELTEEGEKVIQKSDQLLHDYIEHLFSEHIEEAELAQFIEMFKKIKSILQLGDEDK
ncbi:MarR family winged helix-turn-helix transcriptional regulator [Saliterribacillus persicus]|uniref:DNA-binding MarR family transcriptional regulator n=1 Tax=Saliterribacillus persicus TaxID=930114 RepID=A0A368XIM3_9BACI|nr:MarR family transcriptional regulator [Saliterribacillus persicus]RCW65854.1 DNA-binding MarR family transcriptional regulator [Saliterribacillus persicus]